MIIIYAAVRKTEFARRVRESAVFIQQLFIVEHTHSIAPGASLSQS